MEKRVEEAILPLYQQLRAIAQARIAGKDVGTLQATAVVHEALLKLLDRPPESFNDEQHLLACAAQAIRHVVVDYARRKRADKRTGAEAATSDVAEQVVDLRDSQRAALVVDLDEAMAGLGDVDPELRTIVELHVFGGMNHAEIAALIGSSERTVQRRWQFASAKLRTKLRDWSPRPDGRGG